MMTTQRITVSGSRWSMLVLILSLIWSAPVPAQEAQVRSAESIKAGLTGESRGVRVRIKTNAEGYVNPQAADYVSLDTITFELNQAILRPAAIRQLKEVAKALESQELKGTRILIEGHTCNRGTADYNQDLSVRRAQAARDHLVNVEGIDSKRFETEGFGETRPVASNDTDTGQARNRRVDFVRLEASDRPTVSRGLRGLPTLPGTDASKGRFLQVELRGIPKKTGREFQLTPDNNTLSSGDMFQLRMTVNEGCHLYVFFGSAGGQPEWLYPDTDVAYGRWHYFGNTVVLPEPDKWFYLDNAPGEEVLYIIAAPKPLPDGETLPSVVDKNGADAQQLRTALGNPEIQVERLVINHQ